MEWPSWMRFGVLARVSACASVLATTNSTPCRARVDHVVDGVAAGAADAEHNDAWLQVVQRGALYWLITRSKGDRFSRFAHARTAPLR